jgi:hypothetical protein
LPASPSERLDIASWPSLPFRVGLGTPTFADPKIPLSAFGEHGEPGAAKTRRWLATEIGALNVTTNTVS